MIGFFIARVFLLFVTAALVDAVAVQSAAASVVVVPALFCSTYMYLPSTCQLTLFPLPCICPEKRKKQFLSFYLSPETNKNK